MNGFITKGVAALCVTGGLAWGTGCECYRNLVDPCYPERYEYAARQEVCQAFVPQVNNGHVLEQTVWNYQFEPGTDKLTPGGLDHLAYLARRRPCPDPTIFLQTAEDIVYDPATPDKFAEARASLDARRIQALQKYLTAQTADRAVPFEIVVHDPGEVGISALPVANAIQGRNEAVRTNVLGVITSAPGRFPGTQGASSAASSGGR